MSHLTPELIHTIKGRVAERRATLIAFMRELCAIPSVMGRIGEVGQRVAAEMRALGYEDVRFDKMGNVLGRIGNGPKILLYDSHIDTVDVGDVKEWPHDPFQGKVDEHGVFWARGAGDEKQSTPGMLYGLALARDLGLLEGYTAYYFGNMEEDCDGIACHALVEAEGLKPDIVVVGEPTEMNVYRRHKGRVELKVTAKGRSIHAASNQLSDNAIYKMLPVLAGIRDLNDQLHTDPFLGQGRITASIIESRTPSLNAVPDECTIFIDRRMTFGETKADVRAQIEALIPAEQRGSIALEELFYDEPSYTGFVFPVDKYFPAWALEETHPLVAAGLRARAAIGLPEAPAGKWNFSTNGIYWAGKAGIPSIGFGPGDEVTAHTTEDSVSLDDVVKATEFYALLPAILAARG